MMNMASQGMMGGVAQGPWQQDNSNSRQVINESQNVSVTNDNWVCPNCKNNVSGKFCPECGTKRVEELVCKKCNTKLASGTKFCPECGEKC